MNRKGKMQRLFAIVFLIITICFVCTACGQEHNNDSTPEQAETTDSELMAVNLTIQKSLKSIISTGHEKNETEQAIATQPTDESKITPTQKAGPNTSKTKDQYKTDPVPVDKPQPVEPQQTNVEKDETLTCTLSIRCSSILDHMDNLDKEKAELVPEDGIILKAAKVSFKKGESVFDVLLRETKNNKIHMEFVATPVYNSNYIEGIHNLYEFDCGELSGWMYRVNGWFPNYGCSRYQLEDGDVVEWMYTCDLGRDIGADWNLNQRES